MLVSNLRLGRRPRRVAIRFEVLNESLKLQNPVQQGLQLQLWTLHMLLCITNPINEAHERRVRE
jgi:hypothetical protein